VPPLKNKLHEDFARLISQGESPTSAYRQLAPQAKNHNTLGSRLWNRRVIRIRISEINEEMGTQTAMSISHKREILHNQILGLIPTKVSLGTNGAKIEIYDMLGAIMLDSRLSGELDTVVNSNRSPLLKLSFEKPSNLQELTDFKAVASP